MKLLKLSFHGLKKNYWVKKCLGVGTLLISYFSCCTRCVKTCSARHRYLLSPASGHLLSYSVRLLSFVNFVMEIRSEKAVV